MLSEEKLADIVRDEIKDKIEKGETFEDFYYILLDGSMYRADDYDEVVARGIRSANDIYAYVSEWYSISFNSFLFGVNYLATTSVANIVYAYLRKTGFTIINEYDLPPTPNLKYHISAEVELNNYTPEYLVVSVYDIDSLARTLHVPQIVERKLGDKPGEITEDDVDDIYRIVAKIQPLLAGHTYYEAYRILLDYFVFHKDEYKDEAYKIAFAYMNLFPTPYEVCYKWKAGTFDNIACLEIVRRSFSS